MRILVASVPHEGGDRYRWFVAWVLPFTPVGACNYGGAGDVVSLHLTKARTNREQQAQEIFANHVGKVAADMHKHVSVTLHSQEDIVNCGCRGMVLSWMTDHTKGGAAA